MNTSSLKSSIIKNVANVDDVQLLKHIKSLILNNKKERELIISDEIQQDIDLARKQFQAGDFSSQSTVEKRFSKWKNGGDI